MNDLTKELLEYANSTISGDTINNSSVVWTGGSGGTGNFYGNTYSNGYYTSSDLTNYYCTARDFIHDIVKNKFKEDFKFTADCIIEITKEIIDNPSSRDFIAKNMPIIMLKSNDIGVFILNAVINQLKEENK